MLWLPTTTIFKANDAFKVAMFRFFKNRLQQMGLQNYQTPHKFTFFAPNDDAFLKLDSTELAELKKDPA